MGSNKLIELLEQPTLISSFLSFIYALQILYTSDEIRIVLYIPLSVRPSVVLPYKLLSIALKCPIPFIFAAMLPCHYSPSFIKLLYVIL